MVVQRYKAVYRQHKLALPEDPLEQLREAICAVFRSWNTPRAVKYRELNSVTGLRGTAVNVQAMVYGNFNENSCTGVCFTRNPATGTAGIYGEFLVNAQGEDVVAGAQPHTFSAWGADCTILSLGAPSTLSIGSCVVQCLLLCLLSGPSAVSGLGVMGGVC